MFRVEGSGAVQEVVEFVEGQGRFDASVIGHCIRQDDGGGATAVDVYLVCGQETFEQWGSDVANIPEENIVFKIAGATPTPSATVAFSTGPVGNADRNPLTSGRCYMVFVPTGTGPWVFAGYVEFLGT